MTLWRSRKIGAGISQTAKDHLSWHSLAFINGLLPAGYDNDETHIRIISKVQYHVRDGVGVYRRSKVKVTV